MGGRFPSRREFIGWTAGGCALSGAAAKNATRERLLDRSAIETEMRRRAESCLGERYLVVDYYRIRRRLAYPLPVESLLIPPVPAPTIPDYPWTIWMLWALEERLNSLGWAAEWFKNAAFARTASREIEALAGWPKYCQFDMPDLSSAHAGRLLWTAYTHWHWLSDATRQKIRTGCARHVEEVLPRTEKSYGPIQSKEDLLALGSPGSKLSNIPLIGTTGAALTANVAAHPAAAALNRKVLAIMGAILELRAKGHSEGVAYDGYILDFVADWLSAIPAGERNEILEHPNLRHYFEESYMLPAPGAIEDVAALGDVEPREMPFHYSAQAKLERLKHDPVRAWYLPRWRAERVRANALGTLHPIAGSLHGTAPEPGVLNAHYAMVLRTGWEAADLAVAMSCSNTTMDHLQDDSGTVVVGTRGRWIISDPGYQQYMEDVEREFTLGPAAHNYPVINGAAQARKQPRLMPLEKSQAGVLRTKVELAECYPRSAGVSSVIRSVWVNGRGGVVIADEIQAEQVKSLGYHWHGHPDAAWWCESGWMLLHLPDVDLWFTSPQAQLSHANIVRLPGSRGQLTLEAHIDPSRSLVWWIFAIGGAPPPVNSGADGRTIEFQGKRFEV